jgi:hypothetical protein
MAALPKTEKRRVPKLLIFLLAAQYIFAMLSILGLPLRYDTLIFVLFVILLGTGITFLAVRTKQFMLTFGSNFDVLICLAIYLAPQLRETTLYIFIPLMGLNFIFLLVLLLKMAKKTYNFKY